MREGAHLENPLNKEITEFCKVVTIIMAHPILDQGTIEYKQQKYSLEGVACEVAVYVQTWSFEC